MKIFYLLTVLSSFIGTVSAESKDHLLPSKAADAISIQVKQDKRVLNLTIQNSSSMVLTSVILNCKKKNTGLPKTITSISGDIYTNIQSMDKNEINIRIFPSKSAEHYIELEDEREVECYIGEPRGREKKFYELM